MKKETKAKVGVVRRRPPKRFIVGGIFIVAVLLLGGGIVHLNNSRAGENTPRDAGDVDFDKAIQDLSQEDLEQIQEEALVFKQAEEYFANGDYQLARSMYGSLYDGLNLEASFVRLKTALADEKLGRLLDALETLKDGQGVMTEKTAEQTKADIDVALERVQKRIAEIENSDRPASEKQRILRGN